MDLASDSRHLLHDNQLMCQSRFWAWSLQRWTPAVHVRLLLVVLAAFVTDMCVILCHVHTWWRAVIWLCVLCVNSDRCDVTCLPVSCCQRTILCPFTWHIVDNQLYVCGVFVCVCHSIAGKLLLLIAVNCLLPWDHVSTACDRCFSCVIQWCRRCYCCLLARMPKTPLRWTSLPVWWTWLVVDGVGWEEVNGSEEFQMGWWHSRAEVAQCSTPHLGQSGLVIGSIIWQ